MDVVDIVALAVLGIFAIGSTITVFLVWSAHPRAVELWDESPVESGRYWRAFQRSMTVGSLAGWLVIIVSVAAWATSGDTARDALPTALTVVSFGVLGLAALTVVLFNRPAFLVPPHLRDKPGLLADVDRRRAE